MTDKKENIKEFLIRQKFNNIKTGEIYEFT